MSRVLLSAEPRSDHRRHVHPLVSKTRRHLRRTAAAAEGGKDGDAGVLGEEKEDVQIAEADEDAVDDGLRTHINFVPYTTEFRYPETTNENIENWREARETVEQASSKYEQHYPSPENAAIWANVLSKHNTYRNAMKNIRSRKISNNSKVSLEKSAAFMFEPDFRHIPFRRVITATTPVNRRLPFRSVTAATTPEPVNRESITSVRRGLPSRSSYSQTATRSLLPLPSSNRRGRKTRRRR